MTNRVFALSVIVLSLAVPNASCGTDDAADTADTEDPADTATGSDGETSEVTPPPSDFGWKDMGLRAAMGAVKVYHITELVLSGGGQTVYVTFADDAAKAYLARSGDRGATWKRIDLTPATSITQAKSLVELPGGRIVLAGTPSAGKNGLHYSDDRGDTWKPCGTGTGPGTVRLPTADAVNVWDLALTPENQLIVAADNLSNDPALEHRVVFVSDDACVTLRATAPLKGLGVLAVTTDAQGNLYASTEESAEHDDPTLAGQAHVFRSADLGQTWTETGFLDGANRVYRLAVMRDGATLLAGTGIRGEVYRSTNQGEAWTKLAHVPTGTKLFGDPPELKPFDATRVYSILELADGRVLVGTGNATGDIFMTTDGGTTWTATGDTGDNIVCWALAQADDGTVWIGTGSRGGNAFTGTPPAL